MPTFTITPSTTETIKADANGYAEVIYTVTNTSARAVRGIAKLKPLGQTKQEWLKIKGETERDFAPAGTQQFIMAFDGPVLPPTAAEAPKPEGAAPATAAAPAATPTKFTFRLDIALATNMEEDFTEGQVVTVEAAVGEKKKSFPFWIIPIAAVVLIGIGVGLFFLLRSSNVVVPNVVGLSLDEATAEIERAKLVAVEEQTQITKSVPPGQVLEQTPAEGESVEKGSEIRLTVEGSEPLVTVPDVVKRLSEDAKQRVTDAGLVAVVVATPVGEGFQINQVVSQKPEPDEQVPPGTSVELTVAAQKLVPVPDVRFNPVAIAKQKIAAAGLVAEELTPELGGSGIAPGQIKSQEPAPGIEVPEKSSVKLVVAATPTQVPPLKGKKVAEAQALLQPKGLKLLISGTFNESNANSVVITGQSPEPFKTVAAGSPVTAYVPCLTGICRWVLFEGAVIKKTFPVAIPLGGSQ
jgi:beta-lactam-binding protein with PASTA domain